MKKVLNRNTRSFASETFTQDHKSTNHWHHHQSLVTLVFAVAILFSSCEKDFNILSPDGAKKMTVNCSVNDYEAIKVFVTQSSPFSENTSMLPISDAVVTLYINDSLSLTLPYKPADSLGTFGCYQAPVRGEPGKKYSVKVTHPVYGEASAYDFMPLQPDVVSFDLVQYQNLSANQLCRYRLRLNDDATTDNYYRVNVWTWNSHWAYEPNGDSTIQEYFSGSAAQITSPITDSVSDHGWWVLFSDKNFNGAQKEIMLQFSVPDTAYLLSQTILVELHQVSEAHFEFFRTLELYGNTDRNNNPYPVYSNIVNGYGIFMSSAYRQTYVQVK